MTSTPARPPSSDLTWDGADPPTLPRPRPWQRVRLVARALALVAVTYGGIVPVILSRWLGPRLPKLSPEPLWLILAQVWGRICLALCGARVEVTGTPIARGLMVANHTGWIDIFTLLTAGRVVFVSKAEVARWPLVGGLSRQIGTVYIARKRAQSKAQAAQILAPIAAGRRVVMFAEATSTDGQRVLPFKSSLFAGVMDTEIPVQPVSVIYHPPATLPRAFFGWWGAMPLGPHLQAVFALSQGARVEVVFHPALSPRTFESRKALALACETRVRAGVEAGLSHR